MPEDEGEVLGEEGGHVFGVFFDAVPVLFFYPIMEAAAAHA